MGINLPEWSTREIVKGEIMSGFTWQDISKAGSSTLEEEFNGLYGVSDVRVKGRLVMRKGKILDIKWYQEKLARLKRGRRSLTF